MWSAEREGGIVVRREVQEKKKKGDFIFFVENEERPLSLPLSLRYPFLFSLPLCHFPLFSLPPPLLHAVKNGPSGGYSGNNWPKAVFFAE